MSQQQQASTSDGGGDIASQAEADALLAKW
jgi:hypothetical protein